MFPVSRKIIATIALLAAIGTVAGAGPSFAQQPQGPAGAPPRPGPEFRQRLPGQRIEARLAYMKTALEITPAQTKQWNEFANFLRKRAKESDARIEARRSQPRPEANGGRPDGMEMLQRRQQLLTEAAARQADFIAAAKPLYAVLSADQKKTADEVLLPRRGPGFPPRGFPGGGQGPDHAPGPR